MAKEYKCSFCSSHFQDGEFVSKDSRKGLYHTIIRHLDKHPATCLYAAVMNGQLGLTFGNNYLYYQGKLYDFSAIDRLSDSQQLRVDFNENQNGDRLTGNLEGLAKGFFSGILRRIFNP